MSRNNPLPASGPLPIPEDPWMEATRAAIRRQDAAGDDPSSESPPESSWWRRALSLAIIAIAAGQAVAQIHTATVLYSPARWPENRPPHTPLFSANDRSRWCTVWSLAERGTYQIDEIIRRPGWDTIDKVYVGEHFYSSKPPFVAVAATGIYRGLKQARGYDLSTQTHETVQAVLLILNVLPWIAALLVLSRILERYAQTDYSRLFALATAALGTLLTPFLITLNNHTPAAAALIFSLAPLLRIHEGNRSFWRFALAGFFAATCACCELPAALWGLIALVLVCRASLAKTVLWFVPAALLPLGMFFYTNWQATGGVIPVYASFGAAENNPYHYVVDGIPSYWLNPSPLDQGESSPWVYLFHCTLGHHGILSLTPVFLISAVAWLQLPWISRRPWKLVVGLGLGLTVWVLAFYLLQNNSYNYGGVTSGLRWAFWLIPFWVLSLVPVFDRWGGSRVLGGLAAILLGISVYSATMPRNNPWQLPWLYNVWMQWYPPETGDSGEPGQSLPTWLAEVPLLDEGSSAVAVYGSTAAGGGVREFRLELVGLGAGRGPLCRLYGEPPSVTPETAPGSAPLEFDLQGLYALSESDGETTMSSIVAGRGEPAAPVPLRADQSTSPEALRAAFLGGLPKPAQYRWGSVRYLKLPLRRDAFRCRLLAASVLHKSPLAGTAVRYRRVVWWCDELPVGALQIEDTVVDPVDNSLVARQRWTMTQLPLIKPLNAGRERSN